MATDDDVISDIEKRPEWLVGDWQDALEINSYEEWHDVRLAIYGATQAIITGGGRHDELEVLRKWGDDAFQRGLDCIAAGNYEGAPK